MDNTQIIIRGATGDDADDIWRLLHSDGQTVAFEEVVHTVGRYYILTRGDQVLAVTSCPAGEERASLVAVHPLYPQNLMEDILTKAVNGLFCNKLTLRRGVEEWNSKLIKIPNFQFISNLRNR